jgi:hypothetical protein
MSTGDAAGLARLLDAQPQLLREAIREPDSYRDAGRSQHFYNPELL